MKAIEHALACLGLLTLLVIAAFLIDHFTDGNHKLWREAEYGAYTSQ